MKLTAFESKVRSILMDCTGYSLTKCSEDDDVFYYLIDNYGDRDGDPFYEFDDVLDYICNDESVEGEINNLLLAY
jgi:hypothetical protein